MALWNPKILCFCSPGGTDSICRCGALNFSGFIDELRDGCSMSQEHGQVDPLDSGLGCNTLVVYCPMVELPSTPSHSLSSASTLPACPERFNQRSNHEQPTPPSGASCCFTLPSLYSEQIKCGKRDLCIKSQKVLDWEKKKRLIIPQGKRVNDEAGGLEITSDPNFQYFPPHLQPNGPSNNFVVDKTLGMSYHDTGSVMESNFFEPNALDPLAAHSSPGLWPFLRSHLYHQSSFGDPSTIDSTYPRQTIGPPACHLQYQALEEFQKDNRRNDGGDEVKTTSMECVFGSEKWPQAQTTLDHQWGSASNFNYPQDHIACMDQETYGSM